MHKSGTGFLGGIIGKLWFACFMLLSATAQSATYSYTNTPFAWDAPSGAATTVTWNNSCTGYPNGDDVYALVNFSGGFQFTFAGIAYSQVRILSNGMIQFGATDQGFHRDYTSQTLPAPAPGAYGGCGNAAPTNVMLMYWLDINTLPNIPGAPVQYELLGSAPNRRFVITYNNVALYGNAATRYTFQVVLRESSSGVNGNFEYRYTSGSSTGTGATVGVQVGNTDYTLYSFNSAFIDTTNGTNILWYPETTAATAGAVYYFNEASWNGTAGEVIDSSGSLPAQNGVRVGTANTTATTACSTGRAGNFPANTPTTTIDAVSTPITPGNTGSVSFWYRSASAWNSVDSMLFDATTVANRPFYLMKRSTGALRFRVTDTAGATAELTSATRTFAANTWHHIAVTWVVLVGTNQTFLQIFLDGTLLTSGRYTTNGTVPTWGTLHIGDNRTSGVTPTNGSGRSANGIIDTVKIYTSQINSYQATSDMSCTALLDHIRIQSSGTGLTCAANTLTVIACQNAACSTTYNSGATGTLTATSPPTVNWDGTTGGAGAAGFATGGTGSASKAMQVAAAGTTTLGITGVTPVPTNTAAVCNFGTNSPANNNCVFTANTAGFIFANTSTGTAYTVPSQTSGIASNTLYLRALEASTTNPAVCTPAIISATHNVTLGYTCNNPSTCQSGNLATITNTTTSAATAVAPTGTAVGLNFDANASAPLTVRYDDAGQITLNATLSVSPFTGSTSIALNGNSNAFIVAPHHFGFSAITAAPIKAGNDFSATVTAFNGLATPTPTANFGQETVTTPAASATTITFQKCQPTFTGAPPDSTSVGTFSGSIGAYSSGAASSTNLNWDEVGNGDLVATLTNGSYLGSGLTVTGNTGTGGTTCNTVGNVGNFVPDHFDTTVTGPVTCPTSLICPSGGLAYSGQSFITNVTARNKTGGITQNYDGTANTSPNFAKAVTLTAWDALGSTTTQNPPAADPGPPVVLASALAATNIALTAFKQGSTLAPGTPANPFYTFGTTPTAPTDIYIRADDANTSSLRSPANTSTEGGLKVVTGRIKLSNNHGSETRPLSIATEAQYWNGTAYFRSDRDNTTQFNSDLDTNGGNVQATIVKNPLALGDVGIVAPGLVTLVNGVNTFSLAAPGVAGSLNLSIITAPAYLLPSSPGRATFGVYKGANQFIYMREAY